VLGELLYGLHVDVGLLLLLLLLTPQLMTSSDIQPLSRLQLSVDAVQRMTSTSTTELIDSLASLLFFVVPFGPSPETI
jgi:hypothetical protein